MVYNETAAYCNLGSRWLTGYAGAALSRAGEHPGGEDLGGRIHRAEADATGGGRQGLGLVVVSLSHHAHGRRRTPAGELDGATNACAGEQASRGSWPEETTLDGSMGRRRTRREEGARALVPLGSPSATRPVDVDGSRHASSTERRGMGQQPRDAGLLGLTAARLEAPDVCGGWGAPPAMGSSDGGERARADRRRMPGAREGVW
jgi:hypothetical protein